MKRSTKTSESASKSDKSFGWAIPEELGIPPDPIRLRLDFHHQAVTMTSFDGDLTQTKIVSAMDVAHALASELSYSTGLLPDGCLWWTNTARGPMFALYAPPQVRKLALQVDIGRPAKRFQIPLPGFVFLCSPAAPPWVYAVERKPVTVEDTVFKAPLANVFADGKSCPGSHKYPVDVREAIDSFFVSFFSAAGDLQGRSKKFPRNLLDLWADLDGKKRFPMEDLVKHGLIQDLIQMRVQK